MDPVSEAGKTLSNSRELRSRQCRNCGEDFHGTGWQVYCSPSCGAKYNYRLKHPKPGDADFKGAQYSIAELAGLGRTIRPRDLIAYLPGAEGSQIRILCRSLYEAQTLTSGLHQHAHKQGAGVSRSQSTITLTRKREFDSPADRYPSYYRPAPAVEPEDDLIAFFSAPPPED